MNFIINSYITLKRLSLRIILHDFEKKRINKLENFQAASVSQAFQDFWSDELLKKYQLDFLC